MMIDFLLKASISLLVFFSFYKFFLIKESFYEANRYYLLFSLLISFIIPFIHLPELVEKQGFVSSYIDNVVVGFGEKAEPLPTISESNLGKTTSTSGKSVHTMQYWLIRLYFLGVAIFLMNFIFQTIDILLKALRSKDYIQNKNHVIVNTKLVNEPCSFFHFIFINPENYEYNTYEQILAHETIHADQWHSLDLILAELSLIVLWFNPLIWILRLEIEKNIEYQTDHLLLSQKPAEKESYQISLLKIATNTSPLRVTTNYNQTMIKQRIIKMNAKKSNIHSLWKYLFIAPMLFGLLLVVSNPVDITAQSANDTSILSPQSDKDEVVLQESDLCRELLLAVRNNDANKVGDILKKQDANCVFRGDGEPRSPLVQAARNQNNEIAKMIIDAGGEVDFHAKGDETPLMSAAARGNLEMVKYFVEHGAKINKTVRGDGTALISAVKHKQYEVAEFLLKNGADPYLNVPGDEYPMFHARSSQDTKMIELLKRYESNHTDN